MTIHPVRRGGGGWPRLLGRHLHWLAPLARRARSRMTEAAARRICSGLNDPTDGADVRDAECAGPGASERGGRLTRIGAGNPGGLFGGHHEPTSDPGASIDLSGWPARFSIARPESRSRSCSDRCDRSRARPARLSTLRTPAAGQAMTQLADVKKSLREDTPYPRPACSARARRRAGRWPSRTACRNRRRATRAGG
jgi:hypothetical protein